MSTLTDSKVAMLTYEYIGVSMATAQRNISCFRKYVEIFHVTVVYVDLAMLAFNVHLIAN